MNRRAQVTIFIILGVVIVTGVFALIYFMSDKTISAPTESNPGQYIEKCVFNIVDIITT